MIATRHMAQQNTLVSNVAQYLIEIRTRLLTLWMVLSSFVVAGISKAQSVSISLAPEDLDVFFSWFNTMFNAILPIALIGAGLVAGAAFAFVVGTMLKKAFQSLTGGSGA